MSEQRPMDMGGVIDTRREFEEAIKQTMLKIAVYAFNHAPQPEEYLIELTHAHEKYFNSMKGATNTHLTDVEELINAETRRQEALYERIDALAPHFNSVKPLNPKDIYADPYWSHGPSYGTNVEINGTRFYALPRVPCSTDEYVTLKQAPVPANIILIEHDMILMLPYYENTSEDTNKQLSKLLDASGKFSEVDIKEPIHLNKNYLWVHSETKLDERRINELMKKYSAEAFMVGYPGRNIAILYTGLEGFIERLWRTIYFDWDEMWKRYGWYE
ncbi:hypothetical protein E2P71_02905 [Candidatus Bathyarchaeota archaeon]|nr:hypothetical protein E2P71_02905 [Candidatus Bathyarchaeota archaeon]